MKKHLLLTLTLFALLTLLLPLHSTTEAQTRTLINIDNKTIDFDAEGMPEPFINENNRTLVPLRIISEKLGYDVKWKAETQQVIIKKDSTEMIITIGKTTAVVNGKTVPIDTKVMNGVKVPVGTKAIVKDQRTFVPLRFIAENFGCTVNYREENRKGIIDIFTGAVEPELPEVPRIEGTATDDKEANLEALTVLGYEKKSSVVKLICEGLPAVWVGSSKYNSHEAEIAIYNWWVGGEINGFKQPESYKKINPVVKETLRFYFPNDYEELYNIIDGGFNEVEDGSKYINKIHVFDNREVKFSVADGLHIVFSKPGEKLRTYAQE